MVVLGLKAFPNAWHPITTGVIVGQIAKINVSHHDRLYRGMVPPPHIDLTASRCGFGQV